jgi:SNF2 family DNA or RNA helicase
LLNLLDRGSDGGCLRALAKRSQQKLALPVGDNHYIMVPPERVRALLHVVIELYQGADSDSESLHFPGMQAPVIAQLDEVFALSEDTPLEWSDDAELRQRGQRLSSTPPERVATPEVLKATLRPYQQEGLDWLQHLRAWGVGGILADDMGLGKTLQTISHIATEYAAGRLQEPAMVVAPTSLVGNWQRELAKFAPSLRVVAFHGPHRHSLEDELKRADVILTSYPILVRDQERLAARSYHLLILDEAHTIKNRRSQAHKAVQAIEASNRLCLTGTPVENHLGELWSLFDFLNPGLLGDEQRFKQWYRMPIEKGGDEERLSALQQQVSPYILRRLKEQVATELPPKTELMAPVELTGKQRELYESIRVAAHADVRRAIRKNGFAASTIPILDALMKLRQMCCDPRLLKMQAARFVRESAKYEGCLELIENQLQQGRRILLFSQFTSMLSLLAQGLDERKIGFVQLTGSTKDRQGVCDAFESGKADVFLISLKAGGTGLNLTSADTVIHYDPWWNPAAQAQATDRAYRIGQKRPVFVYNLFVAGSVEERMLGLQKKKKNLANAILSPSQADVGLTQGDIETLLSPLDDGAD